MKQLLIVEDDRWLAEAIGQAFDKKIFKIHTASSAHAALPLIDSRQIDLVLLDIFLPRANGLQLLQEFKTHADSQRLPVVVVSASSQQLEVKDLAHLGVVAIIDKASLEPGVLKEDRKSVV